jgi:hypothetical protein
MTFSSPAMLEGAVEQTISIPSVLNYVRFQLLATPMTVLLKDRTELEREAIISKSRTTTFEGRSFDGSC